MDPYLAVILLFGGNFPPKGFATCDGQLMAISQNTALFSLLGTNFGGNGTSTFGLPDLRGRLAIQQGQGPGLSNYILGETTGNATNTLLSNQIPLHTHLINASSAVGTTSSPAGAILAEGPKQGVGPGAITEKFYNGSAPNVTMNANAIAVNSGGNNPYSITQPYLVVTHIIALQGIFPARN